MNDTISDQIKKQKETRDIIARELQKELASEWALVLDVSEPDVRITCVWLIQRIEEVLRKEEKN